MNKNQYLKNQLPIILMNFFSIISLSLFLLSTGNSIQSIIFILFVWLCILILYISLNYIIENKRLNKLLDMTYNLKERYLIAEIMPFPESSNEQIFYKIIKMAEKSMLEKIEEINRERKEYKEYIEQWIHEVKTPITAIKLLLENNRSEFTKNILIELENINHFTEQALYYARSEHTEKDYYIREIKLIDVIHNSISDNKYILRQNNVNITIDEINDEIYGDEKWIRFILNQIISNAVKYRTKYPKLHFFTIKKDNNILLYINDNGIGISKNDIKNIFEKGFTGQNGRKVQTSTGIGLYLCKRLCNKLDIGLNAYSQGKGTDIVLSFHINDFITEVQS